MIKWSAVIGYMLTIALLIFFGIEFELWRWHMFQEATNSTVPFWKYVLLFSK